jgi:hypothetical protein
MQQSFVKLFLASIGFGLIWVVLGYAALGVRERIHYTEAYEHTKTGESLASVLSRFGRPGHLEPHHETAGYDAGERSVCGQSCWLRIWYDIPFSLGAQSFSVDFDATQHVIDKYRWSSP